ncbi:MAG: hypothetical protein ACI9EK_002392, partial [Psychroserpens sp.]
YWTDAAFGGMPTYQLGAKYPHNYIKKLDLTLRFLPRPADYLFLYFMGIYILLLILRVDYKLAFLGALAFGFSTYLIIILGVGHNAKAHAIAYMPLVLSGIILTFRGKYLSGFLLTTVAMALELVANHFQMTYYLLLLVIVLGIAYFIDAYKNKMIPQFFKAIVVMLFGVLLALGLNATNIMATKEYTDASTRGKSELTINPDGSPKVYSEGLDYEYITEYSYGIAESFNLFIPRFMGGGSSEPFPEEAEAIEELLRLGATPQEASQFLSQVPMYWGDQTYVGAPAYIGAVVIFLAVLALFLIKGRLRWWIVGGFMLSLFLSWGKNFSFLTEFFINYIPLYNKFRAVSSIQVIIELVLPIIGMVGLHQFFNKGERSEEKKKALLWTTGILGGISIVFILFKSALFDFASPYDSYFMDELGFPFIDAVRRDRMSLFTTDSIRSFVFVLLASGVLWFYLKEKASKNLAIGIFAILIVVDLVSVDRRYVNNDNFVSAMQVKQPFQKNNADIQILKDDDHFRVYEINSPFNSGRASYFHNALGGYHAAKPGRIQDLDNFYLSKGDIGILNMMNVKYIIGQAENGSSVAQINPYANGNAWFVENVMIANNANEEIQLLDSLNTRETAIIHIDFKNKLPLKETKRDSLASIELVDYAPNHLEYESESKSDQLALFSEVYYANGWNAYINGKQVEYIRANYTLRALAVPSGIHKIEFKFEPQVIKTGSMISFSSSILFLLIIGGGLFLNFRKKEPTAL